MTSCPITWTRYRCDSCGLAILTPDGLPDGWLEIEVIDGPSPRDEHRCAECAGATADSASPSPP